MSVDVVPPMDIIGQLPLDLQLIVFDVADYQTLRAFAQTKKDNRDSVAFYLTHLARIIRQDLGDKVPADMNDRELVERIYH